MPHFRKKPVVIEARQFDGSVQTADALEAWCGSKARWFEGRLIVEIRTLEGVMIAEPQDWVIKGVKGEFYPCKPDIFEATYEPA